MRVQAPLAGSADCVVDPGSFRDRQGRVYHTRGGILRGLSARGLESWKFLKQSRLFQRFTTDGKLVATRQVPSDVLPVKLVAEDWAAVIEHQSIPFVSYPSEWSFGMLSDAA